NSRGLLHHLLGAGEQLKVARPSSKGPLGGKFWPRSGEDESKEFRPVLEVHRVEVSPFATPNETMLLEDLHDVERQAIPVAGPLWAPQPIVGEFCIYVDGRAPCVHAASAGVFDGAAVERTGARKSEFLDVRR